MMISNHHTAKALPILPVLFQAILVYRRKHWIALHVTLACLFLTINGVANFTIVT